MADDTPPRPALSTAAQWAEAVACGAWPTAADTILYIPVIYDEIDRCHTANANLTTGLNRAVTRSVKLSLLLRGMARKLGRERLIGDKMARMYDEDVKLYEQSLKRAGWKHGTSMKARREALAVPETVELPATPKSELTVRDAERERWACWFDSCADLADDMTDGERSGMRHAAIHLRDELVIERVRKIPLASAVAGE